MSYMVQVLKEFELKGLNENNFRGRLDSEWHLGSDDKDAINLPVPKPSSLVNTEHFRKYQNYAKKEFWIDDKSFTSLEEAKNYATNLVTDQENHSAMYDYRRVRVIEIVVSFKKEITAVRK